MVESLTKAQWAEKVLQSPVPVLVKFGAPWCGPCKMIGPILSDLSEANEDITIFDVNIDDQECEGLAQSFNVRGVPTMILFDGGAEKNRIVGAQTRKQLEEFLG